MQVVEEPVIALSINENIEQYIICDLPEILKFSSSYLKEVLNESQYKKEKFIKNNEIGETSNIDLTININFFKKLNLMLFKTIFQLYLVSQMFLQKSNM